MALPSQDDLGDWPNAIRPETKALDIAPGLRRRHNYRVGRLNRGVLLQPTGATRGPQKCPRAPLLALSPVGAEPPRHARARDRPRHSATLQRCAPAQQPLPSQGFARSRFACAPFALRFTRAQSLGAQVVVQSARLRPARAPSRTSDQRKSCPARARRSWSAAKRAPTCCARPGPVPAAGHRPRRRRRRCARHPRPWASQRGPRRRGDVGGGWAPGHCPYKAPPPCGSAGAGRGPAVLCFTVVRPLISPPPLPARAALRGEGQLQLPAGLLDTAKLLKRPQQTEEAHCRI